MKTLLRLFPPLLLFMLLYVQVIALIINFDVYSPRELLILGCWIPVFTIPGLVIKRQWFYVFCISLFFMGGLANLIHLLIIKGPLSASSLFILLNTNINEAQDFLELKFSFWLLLLIPYFALYIGAIRSKPIDGSINKVVVSIVLLFISVFFAEAILHGRFMRKAIPQTSKATISLLWELKTYNKLKLREVRNIEAKQGSSGEQVSVLIIGESCNRNHMSLYGYNRKTNPKLELRKDIVVYNDVVSPYSNTIGSILTMMTQSNLENRITYDKATSLIDVFHSLGYRTYWLSNQSPIGVWDNAVFNLARTSDKMVFTNNYGNTSFESIYLSPYDEKLLQPFLKTLNEDNRSKFIVIHLMGSHAAYSKRYPAEFKKFGIHSNPKEKLTNEYDNSMLYNDYVLDSMLNILANYSHKNKNSRISAVYIGDHGENVFDENNAVGHDYAGSLPRSNVEVPMIVWLSEGYKISDTANYKTIQANAAMPFVSDDLFHAVLDLSHIDCTCFIPERSIFSEKFNASRKRILEDGMDYDKK